MVFTGHPSFAQAAREKRKIPDGLATDNPIGRSYQEVTEKPSFLALATAMARPGTTAVRTATTGQVRLTPPQMAGT